MSHVFKCRYQQARPQPHPSRAWDFPQETNPVIQPITGPMTFPFCPDPHPGFQGFQGFQGSQQRHSWQAMPTEPRLFHDFHCGYGSKPWYLGMVPECSWFSWMVICKFPKIWQKNHRFWPIPIWQPLGLPEILTILNFHKQQMMASKDWELNRLKIWRFEVWSRFETATVFLGGNFPTNRWSSIQYPSTSNQIF